MAYSAPRDSRVGVREVIHRVVQLHTDEEVRRIGVPVEVAQGVVVLTSADCSPTGLLLEFTG